MRFFLISFFILCLALGGFIFGIALPNINSQIIKTLERAGLQNIETQDLAFSRTGFTYKEIKTSHLAIHTLQATLSWPTYLFNRKIDSITVEKVSFKKEQITQNFILKQNLDTIQADIKALPELNIPKFILPLTPNTSIQTSLKKNNEGVFGTLKTDFPNLKLSGKWSVLWDEEDNITMDWDAQNINITHNLLSLNRGSGWAEILLKDSTHINLQLESGSGSFLQAPLNNIRFVVGNQNTDHHLIFRSTASGMPDVNLSADVAWAENFKLKSGIATLTMQSLQSFLTYLKDNNLFDNKQDNLDQFKNIEISISYLLERRFVNGPHPFEILITSDKKEILSGNFLIYPNSFEIRGTLNGDPSILSLMMQIIPLQHERLDKNNIRLDDHLLGFPAN